jgi:hypothetical protein
MPDWMNFINANPSIQEIDAHVANLKHQLEGVKSATEGFRVEDEIRALEAISKWAKAITDA